MSEDKDAVVITDTSRYPTPIEDVIITVPTMHKRMGDHVFLIVSPDEMDGFDIIGANNLNSLAFWTGYYYSKPNNLNTESVLLSGKVSNPEIIDPLPRFQIAFLFYGIDKYVLHFHACTTTDSLIENVETIMKNDPKADIQDVGLIIGAELLDKFKKNFLEKSASDTV